MCARRLPGQPRQCGYGPTGGCAPLCRRRSLHPLVTAPGDFNRRDLDYAERYYAALGAAGVAHVKLGYWHWEPDVPYWTQLDEVRGFVQGFKRCPERYGVKTAIHNHSGASMGLNACAAMNIVKDCDPQHVGIFADPGHLALCGEPIAMALDIVRSHLCLVALRIWPASGL